MIELNYVTNNEYYFCPKCGRIIRRHWDIKERIHCENLASTIEFQEKFTKEDISIEYLRPKIFCRECNMPYIPVKNNHYAHFMDVLMQYGIFITSYHDDADCEYLSNIANIILPFFKDGILPPTHNFLVIESRDLPTVIGEMSKVCSSTPVYSKVLYYEESANDILKILTLPRLLIYLDDQVDLGPRKLTLKQMDFLRKEMFEKDLNNLARELLKN